MRSIIPQDPERPVDESVLVWADEVEDLKVNYLVTCIENNHVFTRDMLEVGLRKLMWTGCVRRLKQEGKRNLTQRRVKLHQ